MLFVQLQNHLSCGATSEGDCIELYTVSAVSLYTVYTLYTLYTLYRTECL